MAPFKAYTYATNRDPLHVTFEELIPVKDDEAIIKVDHAALNPVDVILYNLAYWLTSFLNLKQGVGRDYAGTVEAIGASAASTSGLKVGDKVYGMYNHPFGKGTVSEYITIKPNGFDAAVAKVPLGMSMEQAAGVPLVFGTAYCMMDGHNLLGAKVLVLGGATSVGRYIIQLARERGAAEIITTNGPRSNALVHQLGSTKQIDYHGHKSLLNPVLEEAKLGKFNYIYDCTGNDDLFANLSAIVDPARNDYVTIVGDRHYTYVLDHALSLLWPMTKSITRTILLKLGFKGFNYHFGFVISNRAWMELASTLFSEGKLKVFVDSVFPINETPLAMKKLAAGEALGKVVIKVAED